MPFTARIRILEGMNDIIYGKMADLLLFAVGFREGDKIYLKYDRGQSYNFV